MLTSGCFMSVLLGLVNAGASYGLMMGMVLNGIDHVDNYVDDVLVHTMTLAEHLATLQ